MKLTEKQKDIVGWTAAFSGISIFIFSIIGCIFGSIDQIEVEEKFLIADILAFSIYLICFVIYNLNKYNNE